MGSALGVACGVPTPGVRPLGPRLNESARGDRPDVGRQTAEHLVFFKMSATNHENTRCSSRCRPTDAPTPGALRNLRDNTRRHPVSAQIVGRQVRRHRAFSGCCSDRRPMERRRGCSRPRAGRLRQTRARSSEGGERWNPCSPRDPHALRRPLGSIIGPTVRRKPPGSIIGPTARSSPEDSMTGPVSGCSGVCSGPAREAARMSRHTLSDSPGILGEEIFASLCSAAQLWSALVTQ